MRGMSVWSMLHVFPALALVAACSSSSSTGSKLDGAVTGMDGPSVADGAASPDGAGKDLASGRADVADTALAMVDGSVIDGSTTRRVSQTNEAR